MNRKVVRFVTLVLGCLAGIQTILLSRSSSSPSFTSRYDVRAQLFGLQILQHENQSCVFPSTTTSASDSCKSLSSSSSSSSSLILPSFLENVDSSNDTSDGTSTGFFPDDKFEINVTSFCVPWSFNTDDWWTHHVQWKVGTENATHTCFQRRKESAAMSFQKLYNIQFTTKNQTCAVRKMWSDGFGSDVRNVLDGLIQAKKTRIPFTFDTTPWHYATLQDVSKPVCAQMTMACYFLDLSACNNTHQVEERVSIPNPPAFFKNKNALEFALRPRQWLRKRVYEYSQTLRSQLVSAQAQRSEGSRSCTVVHVRRGDVVLGGNDTSRRLYRPLSDYVRHVHPDSPIFLLTDDANAIHETTLYPNYTWLYFDRPRYRGSEGGWEEHLPSRDPAQEMVVLLSAFSLVKLCGTLVHTASNFAQYLYFEMRSVNHEVRRVNLGW